MSKESNDYYYRLLDQLLEALSDHTIPDTDIIPLLLSADFESKASVKNDTFQRLKELYQGITSHDRTTRILQSPAFRDAELQATLTRRAAISANMLPEAYDSLSPAPHQTNTLTNVNSELANKLLHRKKQADEAEKAKSPSEKKSPPPVLPKPAPKPQNQSAPLPPPPSRSAPPPPPCFAPPPPTSLSSANTSEKEKKGKQPE